MRRQSKSSPLKKLKTSSWSEWIKAFNSHHNPTMYTSMGNIRIVVKNDKKKNNNSDSSWQSVPAAQAAKLPICVTKGHLLSQAKGVTRIFGDYSENDKGEIEKIGNTTIIPNSVIKNIKKLI